MGDPIEAFMDYVFLALVRPFFPAGCSRRRAILGWAAVGLLVALIAFAALLIFSI